MRVIEQIMVKNIVTYDKAVLNLAADPIITIRGRNLDSRLKKDATTKVGKSVLLSTIPNMRFNAAPTAIRKKSGREMHSKGSEIRIRVREGEHKYDLVQRAKGKSISYDVERDGKPLHYRTSDGAMKHIQRLLPMNEQQFYSFNYIDARNPSLLQRGTAAQRFDFFEQVFNLDVYDKIAAEIAKEHNRLKFAAQSLKQAEAEYALREHDMPKSIEAIRAKRENLFGRADKVRRKVDAYLKELRGITGYMTLAEGTEDAPSLKELRADIAEAKDDLLALEERYKHSVKYYADMQAAAGIIEHRVKLNRRVAVLSEKIGPTALEIGAAALHARCQTEINKLTKAERRLEDLEQLAERDQQAQDTINEFFVENKMSRAKADSYVAKKYTREKAQANVVARLQSIHAMQESIAALSHEHKDSKCPICRQNLPAKVRQRIIAECTDEIEQYKKQVKLWNKISKFLKLHEAYVAIEFDADELLAARKKTKRLRLNVAEMQATLTDFAQLERAQDDLAALPKTKFKEQKKVPKPEVFEDTIHGLRERLTDMETLADKLKRLKQMDTPFSSYAEANARYQQLQVYIDKYQPLLEQAQDALDRMTAKQAKAEGAAEELRRIAKRINKYRDESADFKVFDSLRGIYGPKGLRKVRVAEIAARFEAKLNRFASLIFTDPILFNIAVGQNKFDILAARNNRPAADVRTLSGSESRAFVLLCLLALLPFVPEAVRTNLVVLDEMESLMDDPSMHLFTHEFLPKLSSMVPNIVVVTSRKPSQLSIPGAKSYTVVKEGGKSKLVEDNFAENAA